MAGKKLVFIFLAFGITVYLVGCGKKQQALEELQEPMSIEDLSRISSAPESAPQTTPLVTTPQTTSISGSLPPPGPYKPTVQEIQTALKNAGYYRGPIDGKSGPLTKKATEEFQRANGLDVDGKVGSKTWSVLSKYLHPEPPAPPTVPAKKKR